MEINNFNDPTKGKRFVGLYKLKNPFTGEKRIVAQLVEPFELYDIKSKEFFTESEANKLFGAYSCEEYVPFKRKAKSWFLMVAKAPLRVLWVLLYVITLFCCLALVVINPFAWLITGRVFGIKKIRNRIYNLRWKI